MITTTADEHLAHAREDVKAAIQSLSKILVDECWGHDEFTEKFNLKLELAFTKLRTVDKMLNNKDV